MPLPPLPMTMPGRAVKTMTFALLAARSTSTRRDVRVVEVLLDGALDADVLVEPLRVALVLVPLAAPRLDDAEAEAIRMSLLSHVIVLYLALVELDDDVADALLIRVARPIARGRQRRMYLFGALSTDALLTKSASTSTPGDCWRALATALSMSFSRTGAPAFCVNSRSCSASPASRPRTRSTIIRALRGLIRANLALA